MQTMKLFFIIIVLFSTFHNADAAMLSIVPSNGSHAVGGNFSVTVTAGSTDQALNAIDGTISFPTDTLAVTSLTKDGSILNLWVEEPTFSNSSGKVSFSGVAVNPGYTGANGKVLKINFKVKKAGSAAVIFSAGSILANDGKGTNILAGFNNGKFTLGGVAKVEPTPSPTTIPNQTPSNNKNISPDNITTYVVAPRESFVIFPPNFMDGVKVFIEDLFFILLLLLLIGLIWFIVIRVSNAIMLLRIKLQGEVRTVSSNLYETMRQKVDEDFLAGKYLSALTGYQKLQERAPAVKQAELSEKILQANKYYIAEENFKKAKALANRGRWIEAGAVMEENDTLMDADFKYHDDAKKFYDDVEARISDIREKGSEHLNATKKKLAEIEQALEETKGQLVYQQGLLMAEKAKREQVEEELRNQMMLSQEKSKQSSATWTEREAFLEKELAETKEQVSIGRRKLTEILHGREEVKAQLTYQEASLMAEKSKREVAEQEAKNAILGSEESKRSHEQELEGVKSELESHKKKLVNTERHIEEIKSQFTYKDGLLLSEKTKREQLEEELRNVTNASKEREKMLAEELEEARRSLGEGEERQKAILSREFKESQSALEKEYKERQNDLQKEINALEKETLETKKKLSEALRATEGAKSDLARSDDMLKREQEKLKILEEESKKYFAESREKEVAQKKAEDEAMILKEKELSYKTVITTAEEQINSMKTKLTDAVQAQNETKRQLMSAESMLAAETSKREKAEKENDDFALLIKEQAVKIEKSNMIAEAKFKEKEEIINKKMEEAKADADESKKKLAEAEKLLEETKNQLTKEQDLLKAEKARTESLSAAISKLIVPKGE